MANKKHQSIGDGGDNGDGDDLSYKSIFSPYFSCYIGSQYAV